MGFLDNLNYNRIVYVLKSILKEGEVGETVSEIIQFLQDKLVQIPTDEINLTTAEEETKQMVLCHRYNRRSPYRHGPRDT